MKDKQLMRITPLVAGLLLSGFTLVAQPSGAAIPDEYIVQLKPGASPASVAARHGLAPRFLYSAAVNGFAGQVPPGLLRRLQGDADVVSIVPDRVVLLDGKPSKPPGGDPTQVVPEGVKRIGAEPGTLGFNGEGVGVAVVDSGLDFNHADLQPLGSARYSAFGDSAQDEEGHGTHVGGIIAARDNTLDVVGVAPKATLYAVKVFKRGSSSDAVIMGGLDWIAANYNQVIPPIRVVNMSFGRDGTLNDNPSYRAAIQTLAGTGLTLVVSAGNDSGQEVSEHVPATYPEVIAVASATAKEGTSAKPLLYPPIAQDTASWWTTDGAFDPVTHIGVTISAPGEDQEDIDRRAYLSTVGILSTKLRGGTTRMSGTSMSAPHVVGVAALLYQQAQFDELSPLYEQVRSKLMAGADGVNAVPLNSPTTVYTFDGAREGILWARGALGLVR